MPAKILEIPDIGTVHLYKRRGARNLRLSVTHEGKIRVTLPVWTPYRMGVAFVNSKKDWLLANHPTERLTLTQNARIGKAHILRFYCGARVSRPNSWISLNEIRVNYPEILAPDHTEVQEVAKKAAIRALRTQSEKLLPIRLRDLAVAHGFTYRSVTIKQLKSRWGSCDRDGNITLNLFLMQLPWPLIDYVLIHELVHTKFMNHGQDFWGAFEQSLPTARMLRKQIRDHHAMVNPL